MDATKPIITADDGRPIWTFDQLLKQRAVDEDQTPLLAYPQSRHGVTDYESIRGRDLDRFVDGAAVVLDRQGLHPVLDISSGEECTAATGTGEHRTATQGSAQGQTTAYSSNRSWVVGVLARTDLDYIVTVFALGRLGYTPFLISPRLAPCAVETLLRSTSAVALLYARDEPCFDVANVLSLPIPLREEYASRVNGTCTTGGLAPPSIGPAGGAVAGQSRLYIMLHSSGSTGLPKSIDYTHRRLLSATLVAQRATCFQTVPMSHAHGLLTIVQAVYARRPLFLMNGRVAQTHDNVAAAITAANPDVVWTVPYVLKLLAEGREGIAALRKARLVCASGSRTPDELGNMLIREGVHLAVVFGSTETAMILTSVNRPRDDNAWNYLRPPPHVRPYLWMKPVEGQSGVHEAVVLDGHKGKTVSNSDDPPNSWYTSDLFVAHASIPDAWKFVGRKDDRITLLNGEKVLPLAIEGRVRQHSLVREAVVFGVDREVPGLLLFRAVAAMGMTDVDFLDSVWPTVSEANAHTEAFARIGKDTVAVLSDTAECPSTDKLSIKRAQVYRDYAATIDAVYARLGDVQQVAGRLLELDEEGLRSWIIESFTGLDVHVAGPDEDFFSAGVDSLKAIHLRSLILKNVDLGGNAAQCVPMIVYDCGTVRTLARKLVEIRSGELADNSRLCGHADLALMENWIEKYSRLETPTHAKNVVRTSEAPSNSPFIILTGATGFLGAHLLEALSTSLPAAKIFCLLRQPGGGTSNSKSAPPLTALKRLSSSLAERGLDLPIPLESNFSNITPLFADLQLPNMGLDDAMLAILRSHATHVIHCAWTVNFALQLRAFEPAMQGLQHLLQLAHSTACTVRFIFCSSVAAALGTGLALPSSATSQTESSSPDSNIEPVTIPSGPVPSLWDAVPTGYGRSKLVGERVVARAATEYGVPATVFRIGQITPGRKPGRHGGVRKKLWNPSEAVPLIVRSALAVGALPLREKGPEDECRWVQVDGLCEAMIELAGLASEGEEADSAGGNKSCSDKFNGMEDLPLPAEPPQTQIPLHQDSDVTDIELPKTAAGHVGQINGTTSAPCAFYNLVNTRPFSWNHDFLPALRVEGGLRFEMVPWAEWLDRLEHSSRALDDTAVNPARKLVGFWRHKQSEGGGGRSVRLDTSAAEEGSKAVGKWERVVDDGLVGEMVTAWKEAWLLN